MVSTFIWGVLFFGSHTSIFQILERTVLNVSLLLDISSDVALSTVTNMGAEFYP